MNEEEQFETNEQIKKAKRKGALVGSLVTLLVLTICIFVGSAIWIGIKIISGTVPVGALGLFSSGVVDSKTMSKIDAVYALIENTYLNDYDVQAMRDNIVKGVVDSLGDPYSVYYTKEEFDEMMEASSGSFEGIGCYMQQNTETMEIEVSRPMKGSPAEAVGLMSGDIIVEVDGEDISGQDINLVVSKIKGPAGTQVKLGVRRANNDDIIFFDIERALVYEESVEGEMLDEENKIGYIYMYEFADDTANQFNAILDDLMDQGMEKLIIDLRDNGGGYVDVCVDIADRILPAGVIVSTKDKHDIKMEYESTDDEFLRMPIVLLVNENSASASEILTGALKDYDYATVVGENTFGKGIVQNVIPLDDGSGVKLTISEYFTPKGTNIHGVGIAPDVEVELDIDKFLEEGIDTQLDKAKEVIMQ